MKQLQVKFPSRHVVVVVNLGYVHSRKPIKFRNNNKFGKGITCMSRTRRVMCFGELPVFSPVAAKRRAVVGRAKMERNGKKHKRNEPARINGPSVGVGVGGGQSRLPEPCYINFTLINYSTAAEDTTDGNLVSRTTDESGLVHQFALILKQKTMYTK